MNKLNLEKRAQVLSCLVDGNSIRATTRITGVAKNTVIKLLVGVGEAAREYQDKTLRNLTCKKIQVDEIWSFCYAKEKNLPPELKGQFGYGDVWIWTAICPDCKIVPSWFVGGRDALSANVFIHDLAERMANRIQLTSDGHKPYLEAVENAFGSDIDYGTLVKYYGEPPEEERRYSQSKFVKSTRKKITGSPEGKHISTSIAERSNWTMWGCVRRFTRLSNGFSRKVENLQHAVSLHFMYYNFARVHGSLRVTPAMEAGVADHVWTLKEIAALADSN